ncbi:3-oxoacyl-[acyl-carrier protein] reductase [Caldalkalibacillus uzonensis]|uniref:3-oxoacyl-[acyl-carrier protein] reductase n=1 Tax=Caldalkalibacillus uzonensis TaxID=353224 RepID=A0ABU0CMW4_9BACI|nr:3-oxoacyl-ACP reductase [Caldalkalibacillus uzonensis]MDQ0337428.1 3-oxoacyl-[acyl-carrier protein] reductase [Caldalkalibacillus uzonensis]
MNLSLKGKVVLITGSSRGIGAAMAEAFAQQGSIVIINFLKNKERAEQLARRFMETYHTEVMACQGDVTDEKDMEEMIQQIVDEFDAIDVVVNNALYEYTFDPDQRKMAWELAWEDYQHQIDGSLKGTYNVCKHVIPIMKSKGFGRIINMVSDLVYKPTVPYHDYTTAKGALLTYSQNLAADLGQFGITVNCIAPGLVYPTDASRKTKEEVKEAIIAQTPLRRIARPEDVAGSALFFASEWSRFVTGQCLIVDGGLVFK